MDGKLTLEHRRRFEGWIASKAEIVGKCPVCRDRKWTILDHFIDLPIYRGGSIVMGGQSYPNIGLVCTNCGNTQLINAVISGIVEEDQTVSEPEVNHNDG
jgi:putative N-acetylmannosamine-6-phosphate epimerase